jgi:hypothetical protein
MTPSAAPSKLDAAGLGTQPAPVPTPFLLASEVTMRLSRRQIYAYLALGAVVVAVGVRYVVLPGAAGSSGGEPLVLAPAPSSAT